MLGKLNYKPKVTGKQIDSQIKLKKNLRPYQGTWIYEGLLQKLYPEFISNLTQSLETYIKTAEVIFNPVPQNQILRSPIVLTQFSSLISSSAKKIDSNIKKACKGKKANVTMGITKWLEILTQIGTDVLAVLPVSVANSLNSGQVTAPIGAIATPSTGILSSVPAILQTPFNAGQLKSLLTQGLNKGGLTATANSIDKAVKGVGKKKMKEEKQGEQIWKNFLDIFIPYLVIQLETQIKIFMTTPGTNFAVPSGVPGNPIVSGSPTPSGLMPGIIK